MNGVEFLFLRSLNRRKQPPTVHFNKVGVIVEDHTGNRSWTGTKKGLKHYIYKDTKILSYRYQRVLKKF